METNEIMAKHLEKLAECFNECSEASEMLQVTQAMILTAQFLASAEKSENSK